MLKDIKEIVEDVTKIDITDKKRDLNNVWPDAYIITLQGN